MNEKARQLFQAAREGNVPQVAALLQAGADPNAVDKYGETALMEAAKEGHADVARVLLKAGADPNAANKDDWDAVDAEEDIFEDIFKYGRTALMYAAE